MHYNLAIAEKRVNGAANIAAERLHVALAAFTLDDLGQMSLGLARKFIRLRSEAEIAVERLRQAEANRKHEGA